LERFESVGTRPASELHRMRASAGSAEFTGSEGVPQQSGKLGLSCCRRRLLRSAEFASASQALLVDAGCFEDVQNFSLVERLGDYVEASEVEHFRPEPVIGQPGGHDQERRIVRRSQGMEQVEPRSVRQIGIAKHYRGRTSVKMLEGLAASCDADGGMGRRQDPPECSLILRDRADKEDRSWKGIPEYVLHQSK